MVVSPGNNAADASPGIIGISHIPGDEMTVAVHDRLAGGMADIIPEIIPVRTEIIIHDSLAFFNKLRQCCFFFRRQGEIIRRVPEWHYQQVPLGDRELVPAGITERVLCYDIIAER